MNDKEFEKAFEYFYPVGTVFATRHDADPNEMFGRGEWEFVGDLPLASLWKRIK